MNLLMLLVGIVVGSAIAWLVMKLKNQETDIRLKDTLTKLKLVSEEYGRLTRKI